MLHKNITHCRIIWLFGLAIFFSPQRFSFAVKFKIDELKFRQFKWYSQIRTLKSFLPGVNKWAAVSTTFSPTQVTEAWQWFFQRRMPTECLVRVLKISALLGGLSFNSGLKSMYKIIIDPWSETFHNEAIAFQIHLTFCIPNMLRFKCRECLSISN